MSGCVQRLTDAYVPAASAPAVELSMPVSSCWKEPMMDAEPKPAVPRHASNQERGEPGRRALSTSLRLPLAGAPRMLQRMASNRRPTDSPASSEDALGAPVVAASMTVANTARRSATIMADNRKIL